jgi:hypothetical protein
MAMKYKNWITIEQACAYAMLSQTTMRRLIKSGKADKHFKRVGSPNNSRILIDPEFLKREFDLPNDYALLSQMNTLDYANDQTNSTKPVYDGLLSTIEMLKKQLEMKDKQIAELQESERRKDILMLEFQKKIPALQNGKSIQSEKTGFWDWVRFWKSK